MKRYGDAQRKFGVVAYESGDDFIRLQFIDGSIFLYTYESAGPQIIENMKRMAESGKGLNAFLVMNESGDLFERQEGL